MNRTLTSTVLALVLSAGLAHAGPDDIGTKYPVGIEVGGQSFSGILDSGGLTSLSFEDAKKAGLLDGATAKDYREKILKQGGRRDARVLVSDFLGRETNLDAYKKWLDR